MSFAKTFLVDPIVFFNDLLVEQILVILRA
jgi:hypothetical protein